MSDSASHPPKLPQGGGPLAGVRIIDITTVVMGPSATQMLADLGADVIKVEPPAGDAVRKVGPGGTQKMGPLFLGSNRNKRSLALDLESPEGKNILLQLVASADVLAYNVRLAAMARLDLTYEVVSALNPRIVYVGMLGFSQRGRHAASPAFDDLIQAATAMPCAMSTSVDGSPRFIPINLADRSIGLHAFGVIAARRMRASAPASASVSICRCSRRWSPTCSATICTARSSSRRAADSVTRASCRPHAGRSGPRTATCAA